ncbi:MAG: hypothetical protein ACXAC7_16285 [Candidatus Hodarchaeales archaeon]|jgi:hypothetical protein
MSYFKKKFGSSQEIKEFSGEKVPQITEKDLNSMTTSFPGIKTYKSNNNILQEAIKRIENLETENKLLLERLSILEDNKSTSNELKSPSMSSKRILNNFEAINKQKKQDHYINVDENYSRDFLERKFNFYEDSYKLNIRNLLTRFSPKVIRLISLIYYQTIRKMNLTHIDQREIIIPTIDIMPLIKEIGLSTIPSGLKYLNWLEIKKTSIKLTYEGIFTGWYLTNQVEGFFSPIEFDKRLKKIPKKKATKYSLILKKIEQEKRIYPCSSIVHKKYKSNKQEELNNRQIKAYEQFKKLGEIVNIQPASINRILNDMLSLGLIEKVDVQHASHYMFQARHQVDQLIISDIF